MQLTSILATAALAGVSVAKAGNATFSSVYDNSTHPISESSCPNLEQRFGWKTFGDIPSFPYIAGSNLITYNSPRCGWCWNVTYNGNSRIVMMIDNAGADFNLGQKTIEELSGHAGNIYDLDYEKVPDKLCGSGKA